MSSQSYVTERLLAISEALNQINLRAKKIDDLPVQSTLDPSSKIHVSINGESESLQIQKIIESVQVGTYNRLLSIETITLDVNVVTIPALAQWVIDNVNYSNPANINIPVPYCATGLSRKDILVANTLNDIVLVQGPETAGITIQPNLPPNTVYVTEMDVTDSTVGQPQPPEVNGAYVQKSERANVVLTGSGVINQLDLVDEKATIVFKDAITRLNTISYSSVPYNGKRITLFNAQATPVTIGHSVSGYGVDFVFADGQDYILLPNQTIEFSFDITYAPYAHHMLIGSKGITNWSELQGKPSTFPPSAHTHLISEVVNLENELNGKASTNALDYLQLNKEDKSNKNIANGYAGLDSSGKINPIQLPALAITDTFVVASQAEQLALVAEVGDVAVRTDLNKSFILKVTGASTLANWQELLSPTSVDQTIIDGSTNAVSGNAVFGALATKAPISSVHNPVTLGSTNGLSLSNQQISLGLASSGATGALSGADWNTFNDKQNAITGLTTNFLPKWNGSGFGDSIVRELPKSLGIGVTPFTWGGNSNSLRFGVFSGLSEQSNGTTNLMFGAYENGVNTFAYTTTGDLPSRYSLISGKHVWSNAGAGTVGNTFSFVDRMILNSRGALLINKTDDDLINQLQVNGSGYFSDTLRAKSMVISNEVGGVARLFFYGTQANVKNYQFENGISGVSNTGFCLKNITDDRVEWYIEGDGRAVFNSTIQASPATLPNHVVVKSQLDSFVPSGTVNLTGFQNITGQKTFLSELGARTIKIDNSDGNACITALKDGVATGNYYEGRASAILRFSVDKNGKIFGDSLKLVNLPTFANDAAALGQETGTVYKTSTGELRIKL